MESIKAGEYSSAEDILKLSEILTFPNVGEMAKTNSVSNTN